MSEMEKKLADSLAKAAAALPESKREFLLGYAEGVAAMTEAKNPAAPAVEDKPEEPEPPPGGRRKGGDGKEGKYITVSAELAEQEDRKLMALFEFYGWVKGALDSKTRTPEERLEIIQEGVKELQKTLDEIRKEKKHELSRGRLVVPGTEV